MASSGTRDTAYKPAKRQEDAGKSNQQQIARRPADDSRDHLACSCSVKVLSAVCRLLSASMRNVAVVTISSPGLQALCDFDMAIAAAAELDRPRLETAITLGHQHDLPGSVVDDGAGGNGGDRSAVCVGVKHHVGVHVRLQPLVRIGDFDPHADGARFRPYFRINEGHDAFDRLAAISPNVTEAGAPSLMSARSPSATSAITQTFVRSTIR